MELISEIQKGLITGNKYFSVAVPEEANIYGYWCIITKHRMLIDKKACPWSKLRNSLRDPSWCSR